MSIGGGVLALLRRYGPTVFGLFPDRAGAERAAGALGPGAIVCEGGVTEPG